MSKGKIITLSIFILVITMVLAVVITVIALTWGYKVDPDKLIKSSVSVTVLDRTHAEIKASREEYVSYDNISDSIIKAFVALEDKRFYQHSGLDYRRIVSASAKNIASFKFKEGASTITQQLIKNTHLTSEKTLKRKLVEAKLALQLEKNYTKEQIIEMYLNVIYFGSGMYGIDKVCHGLFSKPPRDIGFSEAAVIAGIVKNPSRYSPLGNIERATDRRNIVLKVMLDGGVINQGEYDTAVGTPIALDPAKGSKGINNIYYSNAIAEAEGILGMSDREITSSNYTIYTYLDPLQQSSVAGRIMADGYNPHNANQLSMMIDNNSYGITAYHGNFNALDRNISRQVGSLIKPFAVYAPALESNFMSAASLMDDAPISFNGYTPSNYDNAYHGLVTLRQALMHSYNVPAVKVLNDIGMDASIAMLSSMGVDVPSSGRNLTLALGSVSMSPTAIASMYTALATGGVYARAAFVAEIYDQDGKCIYRHTPSPRRVMSRESAFLLTDILRDCATSGTAYKLKYLGYDIAAKTGTVGDEGGKVSDAWACGFTTDSTLLIWQGARKDMLPPNYGGGGYPALMAKDIFSQLATPSGRFTPPDTMQRVPISHHGGTVMRDDNSTITDWFTNLNMPDSMPSVNTPMDGIGGATDSDWLPSDDDQPASPRHKVHKFKFIWWR